MGSCTHYIIVFFYTIGFFFVCLRLTTALRSAANALQSSIVFSLASHGIWRNRVDSALLGFYYITSYI